MFRGRAALAQCSGAAVAASAGAVPSVTARKAAQLRRCVRCGAVAAAYRKSCRIARGNAAIGADFGIELRRRHIVRREAARGLKFDRDSGQENSAGGLAQTVEMNWRRVTLFCRAWTVKNCGRRSAVLGTHCPFVIARNETVRRLTSSNA